MNFEAIFDGDLTKIATGSMGKVNNNDVALYPSYRDPSERSPPIKHTGNTQREVNPTICRNLVGSFLAQGGEPYLTSSEMKVLSAFENTDQRRAL